MLGDYVNVLLLMRLSHESILFKMVAHDWTLFLKMFNGGEPLLEEVHGFMEETDKLEVITV